MKEKNSHIGLQRAYNFSSLPTCKSVHNSTVQATMSLLPAAWQRCLAPRWPAAARPPRQRCWPRTPWPAGSRSSSGCCSSPPHRQSHWDRNSREGGEGGGRVLQFNSRRTQKTQFSRCFGLRTLQIRG